jgi:hypothetical protein
VNLTTDVVSAAWVAANAAVVGRLTPQPYQRRILSIAVQGPANSTLRIYRGFVLSQNFLMNSVFPADTRFYDSLAGQAPMIVHPGEVLTFAWSGGSSAVGVTAFATVNSQWGFGSYAME